MDCRHGDLPFLGQSHFAAPPARSAVAAAAYRSASRLHDERLDRAPRLLQQGGRRSLAKCCCPTARPSEWRDREQLWNDVEAAEMRKDAQLAREVEFAIPREMNQAQGIELARDFVQREFVDRGMVADLNVHWDIGADGQPKPHAHVMLAHARGRRGRLRRQGPRLEPHRAARRTGAKPGPSMSTSALPNSISTRAIDHRSLEAQGIDLEPQHKIGPAASRMAGAGAGSRAARRASRYRARATARRSSPTQRSRSTRSPTSRRPSPTATWRCSCTGTATARTSSMR